MSTIFVTSPGLFVKETLAAQVTEVKSRKVMKPVDDIVVPTTPSRVTSYMSIDEFKLRLKNQQNDCVVEQRPPSRDLPSCLLAKLTPATMKSSPNLPRTFRIIVLCWSSEPGAPNRREEAARNLCREGSGRG
jgi:hypothetical protein